MRSKAHTVVLPGRGYSHLADYEKQPIVYWLGEMGSKRIISCTQFRRIIPARWTRSKPKSGGFASPALSGLDCSAFQLVATPPVTPR